MNQETQYLSTRQAAEYLGLSTRTLDRYRVSGDGPVFHRFGGQGALPARRPRRLGGVAAARARPRTTARAKRPGPALQGAGR